MGESLAKLCLPAKNAGGIPSSYTFYFFFESSTLLIWENQTENWTPQKKHGKLELFEIEIIEELIWF
jgi:hypothetical protein